MQFFIKTKYHEANDTLSQRIVASLGTKRFTYPMDDRLSFFENHRKTACALANRLGIEVGDVKNIPIKGRDGNVKHFVWTFSNLDEGKQQLANR